MLDALADECKHTDRHPPKERDREPQHKAGRERRRESLLEN